MRIGIVGSLLATATILATASVLGQGSGIVGFSNVGVTNDKRIWINTTGVVGEGTKAGAGYQIALYWGPEGTTVDTFMLQVGPAASFLTTATTTGTFVGGGRTITPLSENGAIVALQARAWFTDGGGNTSYEMAVIVGAPTGKGPIFQLDTKDPTIATEQAPSVAQAPGWGGFVIVIPEPSTLLLGMMGGGGLLMLRLCRNL